MDKKPVIGISIYAVVLLLMGSLSNVVGFQSVQISQQNLIKERINQRELLFQAIVDIANNKQIQRVILKSQMSKGIFLTSEIPVVTKNEIKKMYFIGLILSKSINKYRLQSVIGKYQFNNQEMQKEIKAIIEKDALLNAGITQVKDSKCDCENMGTTGAWKFPILCSLLFILMFIVIYAIVFLSFIFAGPIGQIFIEYFFLILSILSYFYNDTFDCPPINPYDSKVI